MTDGIGKADLKSVCGNRHREFKNSAHHKWGYEWVQGYNPGPN